MDPMQILQMLSKGQAPQQTPIPASGLPSLTQDEKPKSKAEELMEMFKAPEGQKATGGAAMLNPFYNPSSSGMGTEMLTKMAGK